MLNEIVLPETKPGTEWILGGPVQKMSPQRQHALLQLAFARRLDDWARGRGEVATEWRFRVAPPGEVYRPLVPDIAYVSYERMGDASDAELESPYFAPDVVVEIRSIGERQVHIDHKVAVYLAAGSNVVLVINPDERTIDAYGNEQSMHFVEGDAFEHPALEGLVIPLPDLFDVLRRPR